MSLPLNAGFLFSRIAVMPSRASAVLADSMMPRRSCSSWLSSTPSMARLRLFLATAKALSGPDARRRDRFMVAASSSVSSTTSVTMPISKAFFASTMGSLKMSSLARPNPMSRGTCRLQAPSGVRPTEV